MASRFTVDDLIGLAPPPEWRIDAGSPSEWPEVERTLGTGLPNDYKLIINIYGLGNFNDLFFLLSPFESGGASLINQAFRRDCFESTPSLEAYEEIRSISPGWCPFATFPEPGGLLPLGGNMNGGCAFWLTEGKPDDWPMVLYPHGFYPVERHAMPLVDFLVLWLSGALPDCFNGVGKHFVNRTDPIFRNGLEPGAGSRLRS